MQRNLGELIGKGYPLVKLHILIVQDVQIRQLTTR